MKLCLELTIEDRFLLQGLVARAKRTLREDVRDGRLRSIEERVLIGRYDALITAAAEAKPMRRTD